MCRIRYKESPPYHTKKYKDDYDEDFCSYGKMGRLKKQKQNYQKKEHRQIAWKHDIKTYWKHRQGEKCCYCGNKLTEENLTAEHIKPYSKGGKFTITNMIHNAIRENSSVIAICFNMYLSSNVIFP